MSEHIIQLDGELRQGVKAFKKITEIQHECIHGNFDKVYIDISKAKFISPTFFTILGSLIEIEKMRNKKVIIRINNNNNNNIKAIKDSGIWDYYKNEKAQKKNVFEYRVLKSEDQKNACSEQLIKCLPVNLSDEVKAYLTSAITEVFNNAFEHGQPKGVYCSGSFDSCRKHFIFSIYDDGIGIKKNVEDYLNRIITDTDALNWALTEACSTRKNLDCPGGAGLPFLEAFAKCNNGKMILLSGKALCIIERKSKKIYELSCPIKGTLFVMNITVDNTHKYVISRDGG